MAPKNEDTAAKYYDSLIASIATLLVAIASLAVAYSFLAFAHHDRVRALSHLAGLDKLLAIREVALRKDLGSDRFTKRDLPNFFQKAAEEASKPTATGIDPYRIDIFESRGFTADPIDSVRVINVTSRLGQRRCDVAVMPLSHGERFNFATFQIVSKTYWVNSEDAMLVVFDDCLARNRHSNLFLIFRSGRDTVISLPKIIENEFPSIAPPPPFKSFNFYDEDKLSKLLPNELRQFADLSTPMVMVHLDAIEHYILRHATTRHSRFYAPEELNGAVGRLYEEQEKSAVLFGINADLSILVALGPFLLLLFSFEMWRRVRRIPTTNIQLTSFWFATDTADAIGRWTARVYALLPVVCAILMYVSFAIATKPSFVTVEELLRFKTIVEMGTSPVAALDWVSISVGSTLVLLILPIQVALVAGIAKHVFAIVEASQSKSTSQLKFIPFWQRARLRGGNRPRP